MRSEKLLLAAALLCSAPLAAHRAQAAAADLDPGAAPAPAAAGPIVAANLDVSVQALRLVLVEGTTAAFYRELDDTIHAFDLESGSVADTGVLDDDLLFADDVLVLETSEVAEGGVDRNADGDAFDVVLETLLLGSRNGLRALGGGSTRTLPRSLRGRPLPSISCCPGGFQVVNSLFRSDGERLFAGIDEATLGAGVDLNGDGDTIDARVLHLFPTDGSPPRNLGLAMSSRLELFGSDALTIVFEALQSEDLNGAGFLTHDVAHVVDLRSP